MITTIQAKTIPDAWFQLIYNLYDKGYRQDIQSGSFEKEQHRIQYSGAAIFIEYPWMDMWNFIPEGLNIPQPTTQDYVEQDYFPNYLMNPDLAKNETYKYASRIHERAKIPHPSFPEKIVNCKPQLEIIINMLKKTPLTNQAVLEIAKPDDIVTCIGNDGKLDPPCLRLIDFKVIPAIEIYCKGCIYAPRIIGKDFCMEGICEYIGKLILTMSVYFRSWDLWAGLPSNLCGLELLKQYVASECGLENGSMYAYSAGLHLYGYQEEVAKLRIGRNMT